MSNFLVNVKRLQRIFDPFVDKHLGFPINKDRIEQLLNSSDIFPENDQDLERQVAYVIANYDRNPIDIVFEQPLNIDNIKSIFPQGVLELAAAIYLEEETIVATIKGDSKIVKTLLGVDLETPDDILVEDNERFEKINWNINENILLENWANKDFVLQKILNNGNAATTKKNIDKIIKMTHESLWHDIDFVQQFINGNVWAIDDIYEANRSLGYLDSFYEASKNRPQAFMALWHYVYKKIFPIQDLNEMDYNNYVMQQQKYNDFNYYPSYNQKQDLIPILNKIQNELALDINQVRSILLDMKQPEEFYSILPTHIKLSQSVLQVVSSKNINEAILNSITPEYSSNLEWVKMFIETCCGLDSINLNIFGTDPNSKYDQLFSIIYKEWINDKDKVLTILDNIAPDNCVFHNFYRFLPKNLQLDKDIYSKFYAQNKHVFSNLSLDIQLNYVEEYVNSFPTDPMIKLPEISDYLISHIKDKDVLLKIIQKGQYKWLFYVDSPFKNDIDLILAIPGIIDSDFITTDTLEVIEKNKNNIVTLMTKIEDLYSLLSPKNRHDCYIASFALQNNQAVDPIVYNRKGFCLLAMELYPSTANNVPQPYWEDKTFILQLLERIDEERIDNCVIEFLPKEVIQIFTAYDIKNDYAKFINNYLLENSLQKLLPNKNDTQRKKKI